MNFKSFAEEISQKFNRIHIYDLNLLNFAFFYFNLNFSNIHKNQEKNDKKLDQILRYMVNTLFQISIV